MIHGERGLTCGETKAENHARKTSTSEKEKVKEEKK